MINENQIGNNWVTLFGEVDSELSFSHEVYQERYYSFRMRIKRLSDSCDIINITVSQRLLQTQDSIRPGMQLIIYGQLRTYNSYIEGASRLILTVFAKCIEFLLDEAQLPDNPNSIYLNGFICKPPIYRVTPFGREITDLLIAVNRSYNKSDYIPAIAWGRNARYASSLQVGSHITLSGRIQSREYQKKREDGNIVTKIAYEVSISTITLEREDTIETEEV